MHYTLHLTDACNMRCDYCYSARASRVMTAETARLIIDRAKTHPGQHGIIFFGGEPLLCRSLIEETIAYARAADQASRFYFKITTNGLLLDEAFLDLAAREDIFIGLSIDGMPEVHDRHRVDSAGRGTYERVEASALRLLARRPYAPALMTVNPDTAALYSASVRHLYALGFHYIIASLNYAGSWTPRSLGTLREQYRLLADFYEERTLAEDKLYFSPFDVKISSHVNHRTYCHERCELGKKQVSVGPDGIIYPCVQFVGDVRYAIGSASSGIDETRRNALYLQNEGEKPGCDICAIRARCNHHCACLNKQATGSIDKVSPVLCAHERILLPIADRLAAGLFKKRSPMFLQKHYNDFFPLISLLEDRLDGDSSG